MLPLKTKWRLCSLVILLCPLNIYAQPSIQLLSSNRQDSLHWSIAGDADGRNPNILSELIWDDLEIFQIGFSGDMKLNAKNNSRIIPWLKLEGSYGFIQNGYNQDSDYRDDNRTEEYSRSKSSSDEGYTLDLSVGIGPQFTLLNKKLFLAPMVGYSYHEQNLTMQNGTQVIPATGAIDGLDSSYAARWQGPWVGLELNYNMTPKLIINALTEYHKANYYAVADWNLIPSFSHPESFDHHADGRGIVWELGLQYSMKENWSFIVSGDYQKWKTDPGIDQLYLDNGSSLETRLNAVHWKATSFHIGLKYVF